jgi:FAD/FMN-containing dehydrogenase
MGQTQDLMIDVPEHCGQANEKSANFENTHIPEPLIPASLRPPSMPRANGGMPPISYRSFPSSSDILGPFLPALDTPMNSRHNPFNRRRFLAAASGAAVTTTLTGTRSFAAAVQALSEPTEVNAMSGAGHQITLSQAMVQELADRLLGPLLKPGMDSYEVARRVYNHSIDKHPALIAQCTGAADVKAAVEFAADHDLLLAVKGGGHSFSGKGTCEGGLMIDLSPLRGVRVDPETRIAAVEGGSLLGQMDHEAMAFGLATTAGTVSHTGVGGLALGGGFGRLGRRFGLTLDNINGVEIVTADGKVRRANKDENPDLYWGVRGGGGNFGVVTSFDMQLHPMQRTVIAGEIGFPLSRRKEILDFYADFTADAPNDLYVDCAFMSSADNPAGFIMVHVCYSGPKQKADRLLAPLKKLGKPLFNAIRPIDYVTLQRSWDNTDPRSTGEYQKSGFISEISAELIRKAADGYEADPRRSTTLFFQHSGGAIKNIANNATAFGYRESAYNMFCSVGWPVEADSAPHLKWLRNFWKDIAPHTFGFYTNDVGDESQAAVNRNYRGNYERLVTVKTQYDPDNLFRLNANVTPTT